MADRLFYGAFSLWTLYYLVTVIVRIDEFAPEHGKVLVAFWALLLAVSMKAYWNAHQRYKAANKKPEVVADEFQDDQYKLDNWPVGAPTASITVFIEMGQRIKKIEIQQATHLDIENRYVGETNDIEFKLSCRPQYNIDRNNYLTEETRYKSEGLW